MNGSSSLIYGSDDAGSDCNVKMLDENFSATITKASEGLNLAKHFVVRLIREVFFFFFFFFLNCFSKKLNGRAKKGEVEIASCVDLEGHRGSDGRLYMLDFSRTFPPAVRERFLFFFFFFPFSNTLQQIGSRYNVDFLSHAST